MRGREIRGRPAARQVTAFGNVAQKLARNPLGLIALFIVLVYGMAALVTAFANSFTTVERLPLIYFLVGFPVLVLGVFGWLVSRHHDKLYGPGDYQDEDNFMRTLRAATSLSMAASKADSPITETEINAVVDTVQEAASTVDRRTSEPYWKKHILWVDDHPSNNINERAALEALGLHFTLARTTEDALQEIDRQKFLAIISDMARPEGATAGRDLLKTLRDNGNQTPFILYTGPPAAGAHQEIAALRGQGITDHPHELIRMITRVMRSR